MTITKSIIILSLGLAAVLGGSGDKIRERAEQGDAGAQYNLGYSV